MIAKSTTFQLAKKIISPVFVVIAVCFWIYYIVKYAGNIEQVLEKINWLWFFIAMLVFLPCYAIEIFNWQLLVLVLKEKISFFNAGKSWLISNLAKYIPGTVWIPLSRSYITKEENIPYLKSIAAWVFELYFHMASSAVIFCTYLIVTTQNVLLRVILVAVCLISCVIPLLKDYIFELINRIIQQISFFKSSRIKIKELIAVSKSVPLKIPIFLFCSTLVIWILQGLWLYILTYAIVGKVFAVYHFMYIWSFSWFIGFIIIFSPGGFGIREGVMVTLLTKLGIALPSAIVIALLSRFQYLILDGLATIVFLRLFRKKQA